MLGVWVCHAQSTAHVRQAHKPQFSLPRLLATNSIIATEVR